MATAMPDWDHFTLWNLPKRILDLETDVGDLAYTEDNYVTDGESLTNSVDALDQAQSLPKIGSPTYSLIEHHHNVEHSSGILTGGVVTDNGDGSVAATAGTGCIRATDSEVAELLFFDFSNDGSIALTDNSANYIYVDYNAGSPQIAVSVSEPTEHHTKILLAKVYREGTDLHLAAQHRFVVADPISNILNRLVATESFAHDSGAALSETGTRNIAVSAGVFWEALTRFTTPAFDSSGADTFHAYYNDGSWQELKTESQIDNTQYNDYGVGLAALGNNRYGVHWIYMDHSGEIQVVYGTGSYKLNEAIVVGRPGNLPGGITLASRLIGKIIILKSAAVFTSIETAYETPFIGSGATDHNSLVTLQGGAADEYYHADATEYGAIDGADPTYTEQNYVTDAEPVTDSLDALDQKLKDAEDAIENVELSIMASDFWPTITAGCDALAQIETPTNKINLKHLEFDTGVKRYAETSLIMPSDWNAGTITVKFVWISAAADPTKFVRWGVQGGTFGDGDSVDQAHGSAIETDDVVQAASTFHISAETGAVTLARAAVGEMLHLRIYRDGANDDYGGNARLLGIMLNYTRTI